MAKQSCVKQCNNTSSGDNSVFRFSSKHNNKLFRFVLTTTDLPSLNSSDEDGSCVCDQCPGEDEHVQNEVHALLFCQDHRVCELRNYFSFLFTPFFENFSAAQPFLLQQVNN